MCAKLSDEDLRNSAIVAEVIEKLHSLIGGKYFNNKETVIEGFMSLIKVNEKLTTDVVFVNQYADTCLKQIEKFTESRLGYKNQVIKALTQLYQLSKVVSSENKVRTFEKLTSDLHESLKKVSEKASMIESLDEFEEKREEEKQTLQTAIDAYECLPYTLEIESQASTLTELSQKYYPKTNWIIRNSILKSFLLTFKQKRDNLLPELSKFCFQLIKNVADSGEKYDTNLSLISDLVLMFTDYCFGSLEDTQKEIAVDNIAVVLHLLAERNTDDLRKNLDVIKRNINLS